MLTQDSVELNIKRLNVYSALGFFPVGISKTGDSVGTASLHKLAIWRALFICSLCYSVFMAARLEYALGSENFGVQTRNHGSIYAMPLHVILMVGGTGANVVHLLLWRPSRGWLNVSILRDLLAHLPKGKPHFSVFSGILIHLLTNLSKHEKVNGNWTTLSSDPSHSSTPSLAPALKLQSGQLRAFLHFHYALYYHQWTA